MSLWGRRGRWKWRERNYLGERLRYTSGMEALSRKERLGKMKYGYLQDRYVYIKYLQSIGMMGPSGWSILFWGCYHSSHKPIKILLKNTLLKLLH